MVLNFRREWSRQTSGLVQSAATPRAASEGLVIVSLAASVYSSATKPPPSLAQKSVHFVINKSGSTEVKPQFSSPLRGIHFPDHYIFGSCTVGFSPWEVFTVDWI